MTRTLAVCVVVLAIGLAGCAGLSATEGATTPSADPPPGVTTDNVTDTTALVAAHTAQLSDSNFTARFSVEDGGSRLTRADLTDEVRLNRTTRGFERGPTASATRVVQYREGETVLVGVVENDTRSYDTLDVINTSFRPMRRTLVAKLSERNTSATTVERVTHDGATAYRINASLQDRRFVTDQQLVLVVRPDGLVERIEYTATFRGRGDEQTTRVVEFSGVGETSVTRPPWYDEALNATGS